MKNYYIFQNGTLDADDKTIRFQGSETRKIPIEQIDGLHLFAGFTITSGALKTATDQEFPIHMYGFHGNYIGSFIPKNGPQGSERLLAQCHSHDNPSTRLAIGKGIIGSAAKSMNNLLKEISEPPINISGIESCISIESLRLEEARIRKEYYKALDCKLSEHFAILGRTRRPPSNPGNCLLGFWNGLIYSQTLASLYRAGLDARIGYLHGDVRATNPLALDLAELFKTYLSESLLIILSDTGQRPRWFTEVGDGVYLNEIGRKEAAKLFDERLTTVVNHSTIERYISFRDVMIAEAHRIEKAAFGIGEYYGLVTECMLSSHTICQ